MYIRLTHIQYELFTIDMDLELDYENNFSFDITYLAQKVVGHDKLNMYCDASIQAVKKDNYVEITDLGITSNCTYSDEYIILINEKVVNLIKEYKLL